ncbi:hypothetical protein [Spirillospora sp. NPDC047279]|uniref:hypothetical protein n=1 Tax=Spirillospora sp. NPDC047279 TaxID=3155478 RepID=UPI0033D4C89B
MTQVSAVTPGDALKVVGARVEEVVEAVTLYGGEPYLVGSLAAGLGDHRSDIDVHVVSAGERPPLDGPVLAFTPGGACVDVRYVDRAAIDRVVGARPFGRRREDGPQHGGAARRTGRGDAWLLSRWLTAVPLRDGAPPLLDAGQRRTAAHLITMSLASDLTALAAFAALAERAGADRAWYLARRAGTAAWELAATLAGRHYLGERWLPARSAAPEVAAVAELARAAVRAADLDPVQRRLGIDPAGTPGRVHLHLNPEAERWTLAGEPFLLVASRRLVPALRSAPETVAGALEGDAAAVFSALAGGTLRWTVDVGGIVPRLEEDR